MSLPVIDLFAGPGGLGEGFSSLLNDNGKRVFKIKLSVEKDEHAHRTLELRAFFREFSIGDAPDDYYDYLSRKITREELFKRHPVAAANASREAWLAELGAETPSEADVDERISAALGSRRNWVLIGGPPCQAYSLVGRSRVIGGEGGLKQYEADPRHRLYRHYLRILAVHRPPVFVMENVKGLLSARLREEHIFERILRDLADPAAAMPEAGGGNVQYHLFPLTAQDADLHGNYQPDDFVVCAEKHGLPQARHRVIILGIRTDFHGMPDVLQFSDAATVQQVIGDLPRLRSGLSKEVDSSEAWREAIHEMEHAAWMQDKALDPALRQALQAAVEDVTTGLDRGAEFLTWIAWPETSSRMVLRSSAHWRLQPRNAQSYTRGFASLLICIGIRSHVWALATA